MKPWATLTPWELPEAQRRAHYAARMTARINEVIDAMKAAGKPMLKTEIYAATHSDSQTQRALSTLIENGQVRATATKPVRYEVTP